MSLTSVFYGLDCLERIMPDLRICNPKADQMPAINALHVPAIEYNCVHD